MAIQYGPDARLRSLVSPQSNPTMLPAIHIDPDEQTPITQGERAQIAAWLSAWLSGRCAALAAECGPRSRGDFAKAQTLLDEARAHYAKALTRGARYWCPGVLLCAAQAGMVAAESVRLAGLRIAEYKPKSKRKTKCQKITSLTA